MKTIKIVTLLSLTILLSNAISAQTTFGFRAGVNFQNLNGRDAGDDKIMGKLRTGFNAGVNAEIPVGVDFYLQPGVLFSLKGAKQKDVPETSLSYIEIPVNFIYKPALGTGRMLLGFGPYAGIAVDGKTKIGGIESDIEFGSDPGNMKRFDAGANLLAGYEFSNKLSFQLNAQLGLLNMIADPVGDSRLTNTGFGISLGYRLGQ